MGKVVRSALGIIAVALVGAGLGVGLFWTYAGPPSTEQRWHNAKEVSAAEDPEFASLLNRDTKRSWRQPSVTVYSAPAITPRPAPVTMQDLSDHGQAALIDAALKGSSAAGSAWHALMSAMGGSGGSDRTDPYRVDRVLIATVAKGLDALPGERLLWTRVFIQPINFKFAGYTVAATDSRSMKVASIESDTSTKLSLNTGAGPGLPGLAKPDAGQAIEKTQRATSDISEQYENLGIDIQPEFLRIIRESAAGSDVAGNAAVRLSMVTDPKTIWCEQPRSVCEPRPRNGKQSAGDPTDDLVLLVSSVIPAEGTGVPAITVLPQAALPHCPLKANVWMLYEMRHIISGRQNYVEGTQEISLLKSAYDAGQVDVVPADDVSPSVWSIKVTDPSRRGVGLADGDPDLTAQTGASTRRKLVFTDNATASELAHWLKLSMASNAAVEPTLKELRFNVTGNPTLTPYKHVDNDCDQPPESQVSASR